MLELMESFITNQSIKFCRFLAIRVLNKIKLVFNSIMFKMNFITYKILVDHLQCYALRYINMFLI